MRGPMMRAWICVAVFCGGAQAADNVPEKLPWEMAAFSSSPEAALKAATQLTPPEKAVIDILLDETKLEFDASKRVRKTHRQVYRLLRKEALEAWSVAAAEWSPWHQERPQIQARVISTDGQAHALDVGTITESPVEQSGQVFRDRRRLVAPLPAVEVGAIVELQTVIAEHRAFCDEGVLEEHHFFSYIPVRSMRLVVEAPEQGPPVQQRVRGIELTPRQSVENGLVRLEFGPLPVGGTSTRIEYFLPAEMPVAPHVVIGNGTAWANVAQYYSKIVDRQIGDASYADLARMIVGDEKSREAIVQKLLDAVQQRVRYAGVEFGESTIVPHSPQETLSVRYGDCKDQSALLVALLRSLGHAAHVALVRVGRREDLLPDVPALNAFDHAIVYVPGSPPLWVDPTALLLRVGELPIADMGRLALVAAPTTTELLRAPESQSADNSLIHTRELVLAGGNRGRLRESCEYKGSYENRMRVFYAQNKPEDLRAGADRLLKQEYGVERAAEFKFSEPRDLKVPFRVSYEAEGINFGVTRPVCSVALNPEMILDDVPWLLKLYGPSRKPAAKGVSATEGRWERTAPLQFPWQFLQELRFRVILPNGFVTRRLPDSFAKQFGPAKISAGFVAESANQILATFRLDSGSGRLSPDEARALYAFLSQLHSGNDGAWLVTIELEHAASQLFAQGRVREGLAEFQRLIAQDPADMENREGYIESLVAAGMGAAARDEARRATELDAKSASAWQSLGFARMHDDFGRFMGQGNDPLAAEAALRKAVEIDPQLHSARWYLAVALEFGKGPWRYAPGPRLNEAAEHYRALRAAEFPQPELPGNFLCTLAYLDQWQEMISLAGELAQSPERDALWVAAVAVTANGAAAKAKAFDLARSNDGRRDLLLAAGNLLNGTRRYAASAELVEHALPLIADAEQRKLMQGYVTSAKATRRMDEALFPAADPRRLVQQLLMAALSGSAVESASPLFVEEAGLANARAALEAIRTHYAGMLQFALKNNRTSERTADAASLIELKFAGDADVGYRVEAGNVRWYVVQRNGDLRLLPPGVEFAELGREALRRLEAGDEAGARRWLEWGAVELPPPTGFFADPFSASPFGFLWNALKRDHLKFAAAILAAGDGQSDEAVRLLSEFQQTATMAAQILQVDRAQAGAFASRKDWERFLEVVEHMLATHKTSDEPRRMKLTALRRLGRRDEFRELEEQYFSRLSGNARAWAEGLAAAKRGDFELSQKLLRPLADDPKAKAEPYVFNELAWDALFRDEGPGEAALEDAVKANAGASYRFPRFLHTLAAVHAELAQPVEAQKFLMQAIDARNGVTENGDLYVLGRIAECYGLNEIAARHHAQIEPEESANSTYQLAQRRLKRLPGR